MLVIWVTCELQLFSEISTILSLISTFSMLECQKNDKFSKQLELDTSNSKSKLGE